MFLSTCQLVNLSSYHLVISYPISASLLCHLHLYTVHCTGCIQNNKYRKQLMLFCYNSYSQVPRPTPRRGPCLQLIMLRSLLLVVLPSPVSVQVWPGWVVIITRLGPPCRWSWTSLGTAWNSAWSIRHPALPAVTC